MKASYTAGDLAEQAGSRLAHDALTAILNALSQAESLGLLQGALLDLQRQPHPKRAAAGFAVVMISAIELGLGAQL